MDGRIIWPKRSRPRRSVMFAVVWRGSVTSVTSITSVTSLVRLAVPVGCCKLATWSLPKRYQSDTSEREDYQREKTIRWILAVPVITALSTDRITAMPDLNGRGLIRRLSFSAVLDKNNFRTVSFFKESL